MRIGIDARSMRLYPGVGRYAESLIRWLGKIDSENEYVIFKNRRYPEKITDNPKFKEMVVDMKLFSFQTLFTFHKLVMKEQVDFLHCTYHISPLSKKLKKIVTVHDLMDIVFPGHFSHQPFLIEQGLKYYFKFATPRTVKGAVRLMADSQYTKSDILRNFPSVPPEQIDVVYLAVEDYYKPASKEAIEKIKEKYALPENFLLYVGNTKIYKNLNCMIKAYAGYCKAKSKNCLPLIIAGLKNVAGDILTNEIASLGLADKIKMIGTVDEQDLPVLYSGAEFFVFPSLYEGFGFPPLEAMSCGTPVIVSNATSIPEVVGDAGLYFDPRKPDDLAEILINRIDNPDVKVELREKGFAQAKKFSLEKMAKEVLNNYYKMK